MEDSKNGNITLSLKDVKLLEYIQNSKDNYRKQGAFKVEKTEATKKNFAFLLKLQIWLFHKFSMLGCTKHRIKLQEGTWGFAVLQC